MPRDFDYNDATMRRHVKTLKAISKVAIPRAASAGLNGQAFAARKAARELTIPRTMLVRVKRGRLSAPGSVFVNPNRQTQRLQGQIASVGSVAKFMRKQELGGRNPRRPIPSTSAAGQSKGTRPRGRAVRPRHNIFRMRGRLPRRRVPGATRAQRNRAKIEDAKTRGKGHVFLDFGGKSEGIYYVTKRDLKLVWSTRMRPTYVKSNPWLRPASQIALRLGAAFYRKGLRKELARLGARG